LSEYSFHCCGPLSLTFTRYRNEDSFEHFWKEVKVMQAGQLTIATPTVGQISNWSLTAKITDWVARVFGCWHLEMSRPFSHHGQAYRSCLDCGAQRQFNLKNWKMQGEFYYHRSTLSQFYSLDRVAAVRRKAN
jgi:hypothetical protein